MATPAMAGPTKLAPVTIDVLSATALPRFSRPTISTTNDWRVGLSTAMTAPRSAASTKTCPIRTWPLRVRDASTNASVIAEHWVMTSNVRRRYRSASSPPIDASRKAKAPAGQNVVSPRERDDPVRRYTSQLWASDWVQVPTSETAWPAIAKRR